MLSSLGRLTARRRWWVVVAAVLLAALGGVWGTGTFGTLTGGAGFDDPHSESVRADRVLAGPLGRQSADLVVLYTSERHTVDDPAFAGPVREALDRIPREGITRLETYWTVRKDDAARAREFVSRDHHATYATVQFAADGDQDQVAALGAIKDRFAVPAGSGVTVRFGGTAAMTEQVNARTGADIGRAEALSLPILMVLLLIVFGSVVAASLPLAVGVLVALGSLVVLRTVSLFTDLSSSVINVITILGLGLAIDYALFMVGRFREELAAGADVDRAVERTTATAGHTVAFSGLAVAISFTGLTLFPSRFLSSMGYAAVAVVIFAVIGSLTLLPALLRFAGHRIDAGRLPFPRRPRRPARTTGAHEPGGEEQGRWYRLARAVMRRPLLTAAVLTVSLLGLAGPALGVNWARPADWVLPADADARQVTRQLQDRFDHDPTKVVTAVVDLRGSAADGSARLAGYAERLGAVEGVEDAAVTAIRGDLARITLRYTPDPMSREARAMVEELRAQAPPPGAEARFTGMPASRVDIVDMIGERALWMGLFVAVVSAVVLFLAFRSLAVPLITVAMSALSLLAAFGVITLIFQYGVGAGALGFEAIGAVDANFPVLIVAIAFGLAMDYQVFLLSRVREHYLATGDPAEATATALQRTAGTITSAGLLLAVVVGGFAFSSVTFLKMIGIGLVLAIALDVLVVRALMLPAVLGLLGHRAWGRRGKRR
ncbi:MMPL family transporter [Streptomyces sparsogenes]|uniref:MMPL family transporter n=1 Tax=Streptomyces sparsogenes TaxID=67365 RepID=UPI00384F05F9